MAERVFEDILTIVSDEAINKNLQIAEKKAFLYSFLLLKDFGKPVVKKKYDENDYDWICQNDTPKDFCALVRFTIMTKFCK